MTLATSSSIHHAKQYGDDRRTEIQRDAERTRVGVLKTSAPADVLPKGVDDLTPVTLTDAKLFARKPRDMRLSKLLARLIPA